MTVRSSSFSASSADPARPGGRARRRILRALLIGYVAATCVHVGYVVAHEPFVFDAWNVASDTRAEPFSLRGWLGFGVLEYTHSNPRIGQWLAYPAYKLTWFEPIATPLVFVALALAVTVLGLGRWPAWRRGRDLALGAIALGSLWFALPRIGMILFNRAYCTNYVYGAAIQLWFVVALRLGRDGPARWPARLGYGALGVAAGMSNEHTGPALVGFALAYAVHRRRAGGAGAAGSPRLWAGAAGAAIGFVAIFFGPGQDERYEGLATKISLVGRLLQRGVPGNLDIVREFVIGAAPVLGLVALALAAWAWRPGERAAADAERRQTALRVLGLALLAGLVITATVFVSPRLGARFYLHGCALVLAALIGVLDATSAAERRLIPFVALAVAASIYAGVRTVPLFRRLAAQSAERLAALSSAPRGAMVTVESFDQVDDTWWFQGDDLRTPAQRETIAAYFGLGGLVFRAVDLDAPLGVSDVRLVPRAVITPPGCLDDHGGFEITGFRGLDVGSIQRAVLAGVARTRARLGSAARLDRLDVAVELIGAPPALPRKTLLIGRWRPDRFEAWAGAIERRGAGRTRSVVLPEELRRRGGELEIFVYHLGGPAGGVARRLGTAADARLEYVPWARGGYWALACNADECFVIAAVRAL